MLDYISGRLRGEVQAWLDRPLSKAGSIICWIVATIVFFGMAALIGGPVEGDAPLSVFTTWAIAHGHIACAYSLLGAQNLPTLTRPVSFIPPLYPLISSGVLFAVHSTYNVPFPTIAQLGNHCRTADAAIFEWSARSSAIMPTIRIAYLSWFALMAGTIAVLRATGRGRRRWEPTALIFVAVAAPVFECLTEYFHPQDLLAMGLALASLACALRGRWAWAGVIIGLAFTSNQFALLFAGPIFVMAPTTWKIKFGGCAVAIVAIISLPLIVLTSGDAFKATILGSGFTPAKGGGSILSEAHLSGLPLFALSRLLPIALAVILAWWAKRRLGDNVLNPIPFLSIIATALSLRLVFEFSLYGYFFMGVTTLLILIDVISGQIRGPFVAWLALVTAFYDPFPWGFASNGQSWGLAAREWLPNVLLFVAVAIIIADFIRHHIRWYVVATGLFIAVIFVKWPWNHEVLRQQLPTSIIQLILVPIAFWLAISPLIKVVSKSRMTKPSEGVRSAAQ